MANNGFKIENGVLKRYTGTDASVVIPYGVTSIGNEAFRDCRGLTSISIPDSVTSIGASAFSGCSGLASITIPGSVTSIEEWTFRDCSRLKSITISAGVTSIGDKAFSGCSGLTSITIPDSVTSIGAGTFEDCSRLTSITIPDSVTSIGAGTFEDCSRLTSITIPDNVTSIEQWTFKGCTRLMSISIPDSVTFIGYGAFEDCRRLADKDGFLIINDWLLRYFGHAKKVVIPSGIRRINSYAFFDCHELTSITIPGSVMSIESYEFTKCYRLEVMHFNGLISNFEFISNVRYVFPENLFVTTEKVSAEYCKPDIKFSDKEVAFLMLYQKGEAWKKKLRISVNKREKNVFDYMLGQFKDDPKAPASAVAKFIETYYGMISAEQVAGAVDIMKQRKWKGINKLFENPAVSSILSGGPITENPIEARVRELCKAKPLNPDALNAVIKGIPYAGSKQLSSVEAVAFILSEYLKEWKRCAGEVIFPEYETYAGGLPDGKKIKLRPEADEIAEALDNSALRAFLDKLVSGTNYFTGLKAWARYADDDSVYRMTSSYNTMIKGKEANYYKAENIREALLINDTRAAMQFFDRIGQLERYAKIRGMSAMDMRDSVMLPEFAFDADGVKRYDIGGKTIEVTITPEMEFCLFDVNAGKRIKSIPKKSNDPAKAQDCAKDFAAFKKEVIAFAKERTALLHSMHLSGQYVRPDLWRKVYVEHPVIRHLAQLLVWQDEAGKTFTVKDGSIVDAALNAVEPQGRIRVAHVLDMQPSDIAAWQQLLTAEGRKQLFEQVWEPVITWTPNDISKLYEGVVLSNEERNAHKKALKARGIECRVEYEDSFYNYRSGKYEYSDAGVLYCGDCLQIKFEINPDTKEITLGEAKTNEKPGSYAMNAILLETEKAALRTSIVRDDAERLIDAVLGMFSVAQISDLLNTAIDANAVQCTAKLLDYKNEHFPEYESINEFSLDW